MNTITYEWLHFRQYNLPIRLFCIESNKYSTGCEFHWHEQLEFYYVISGGLQLICNGKIDWAYAGDIVFVNWCNPHKGISFLDNTKHYIIQIDISKLLANSNDACNSSFLQKFINASINFPTYIRQNTPLKTSFDTLISECNHRESGFEFLIKSELYNILGNLLRIAEKNKDAIYFNQNSNVSLEYIQKLIIIIHENYSREIELKELSDAIGVSIPYMCKIFKEHTGLTIIKYIHQIRCYSAISLILNGNNISEASLLVGFSDYNYFSRVFKKTIGYSPSEYIEKSKQ